VGVLLGVLETSQSEVMGNMHRSKFLIGIIVALGLALLAAACGPDTTPPTVTVTFPVNGGVYNAAAWNAACAGAGGTCGTASDDSGVASVELTLRQVASGKYWDGNAFTSNASVAVPAAGTTSWTLGVPLPHDGDYVLSTRATDANGNASAFTQAAQFTIDTVAPAAPTITSKPAATTFDTGAQFTFTIPSGTTATCGLDGVVPSGCTSPANFTKLAIGQHCIDIRTIDLATNVSVPASYCWTIVAKDNFAISGSITDMFAPGVTRSVNLTFGNANNFAIKVVSVTITVQDATTKNGQPVPSCIGSQNLAVTQAFSGPVTVPANTTATLSGLGVPPAQWPQLRMPNLPVNQDACKGASFKLTYTGTATK
jgi:hypothetical protein